MATSMEIISRGTGRRRTRRQPSRRPGGLGPHVSRIAHQTPRFNVSTFLVLPRRSPTKAGSRRTPLSPQNCAFSIHFPLHILKTHTSDRCRSTTCAKCRTELCNSQLTLLASRITHHANVSAKVHRFYTVSTPFFDSLFAIQLPPNHLHNTIHQIVTIRCNSALTLPVVSTCPP
jgi:hypothetical protein